MIDPETCSWCLVEVEDSTLREQPDGARICPACAVAGQPPAGMRGRHP